MAPIFWISRRFAEAKYKIMNGDDNIADHDLLALLNKPNPYYSGRLLRMASALSYNTDGNVYWIKIRNKQLKPIQLWYVPHWLIEPHWPQDGSEYIDYYKYQPGSVPIKIYPEDIVHIRNGIDPFNIRKGQAPLKSLFREIFTDDEAANFSASLLRNMGIPGLLISPGTDNSTVTEDDKNAVKLMVKSKTTGDKRGEPLVMSAKTDIKQFGYSPANMDLSALRGIPEERVCAILGVSAAVVGFGTGLAQTKVGATMREMRESSYEDCIIPMQNLFADEINTQLLPDFEENADVWRLDFDLSDIRILQEDENSLSTRVLAQMAGGLIKHGEARQSLGYENDAKDGQDVYFMPNSITVTSEAEVENPPPPPEPKPPVIMQTPPINDNTADDLSGTVTGNAPPKNLTVETKGRNWKTRLAKELNRSEKHLSNLYSSTLEKQFNALGDAAASTWKRTAAAYWETLPGKSANIEMKDPRDDAYYADLISGEVRTDIIDYKAHYMRVTHETFSIIDSVTTLMVNLTDPAEARIIKECGTRKGLLDIKEDTRRAIYDALSEARAVGEGADAAAARIKDLVSGGHWSSASIRAKCIARTETKNAQNMSSLEAYKSGGVMQVEIVDGQLATSDEDCINRNGDVISIDDAENIKEHPNGTLSWSPVIEI
jgi:HK97 family phage portal protein